MSLKTIPGLGKSGTSRMNSWITDRLLFWAPGALAAGQSAAERFHAWEQRYEIDVAVAALPRVARSGGKLPETLNGRLAVRVALAYDSVQNLKRQLDQLAAPRAARPGESEAKG